MQTQCRGVYDRFFGKRTPRERGRLARMGSYDDGATGTEQVVLRSLETKPATRSYMVRCLARPAWQQAMQGETEAMG